MEWYKKRILEDVGLRWWVLCLCAVIVFLLLTAIFEINRDGMFSWKTISPIDKPTLTLRIISAFSFIGVGKLLYKLGFYKILYFFLVVLFKERRLYKDVKKIIWYLLMFITGFVIVPWIIDIINGILSLFYNVFRCVLYIGFSAFLSLCIIIFCYFAYRYIGKFISAKGKIEKK